MNNLKNAYIALLRGINVGGNNSIKMAALKQCFETMGFTDVVTYIQSGNVLFTSPKHDQELLTEPIESTLSKTFNYKARVVTVSHTQLKETVEHAPHGFGTEPAIYRYDVVFLKPPLTASEAMKRITIKEGVDQVYAGKNVLYFSRLIEKATQSRISSIISLPIYQNMTIRNWNTTTKLLALMEKI